MTPVKLERLERARPGRPCTGRSKPKKQTKPFVAVDPTRSIWTYCRPEYQDTILITYGLAPMYARQLTEGMDKEERWLIMEKREIFRSKNRAFRIHLKNNPHLATSQGGTIWLKNQKGQTITIHDVKGMFQIHWSQLTKLYSSQSLVEILERTRSSLSEFSLTPIRQQWYRCSSITDRLWDECERRHDNFGLRNVPALRAARGPGNLQGYGFFGHTTEDVYSYDIRSAYLSIMARFTALQPFTDRLWAARQSLEAANDPAAFLIKLASTVMPGKFGSKQYGGKFYRPVFAQYIRQAVNEQLLSAMRIAGMDTYRWCVDGFIAGSDISPKLDIGSNLGQWKPPKTHHGLTIAGTNLWWTNQEHKNNGYQLTERDVLTNPFHIQTSRKVFDWRELEDRMEPITIDQPHDEDYCNACANGAGLHTLWRTPRELM